MKGFTFVMLTGLVAAAMAGQSYQLVWSDEFNGNSLDTSKWGYQNLCDGAGNNEMECYTSRPQNVAVQGGNLVLSALIENYGGKQYTSGRISTSGKYSWKYGRFEVRAKIPNGIYLWPAIWMMPESSVYGGWAASGEIDIMENRGGQNNEHSSTLHYGGSWPKNTYKSSGSLYASVDLTQDFHVYSAIWTPDAIQFALDGNVYFTVPLQQSFNNAGAGSYPYSKNGQPFDQNFHFILNLAVGGGFFGANSQSLTTAMARGWANPKFLVDYVRVYQLKDDNIVVNPSPVPTASSTTCQTMFNSLKCRTSTNDVSQLDSGKISGARAWLCNNYGKYCNDINNGGSLSSCNAAEQISYAMNSYYQDYSAQQGAGACDFGGLGKVYTTQTPTSQTPTTKTPASTVTPTTSSCPSGQSQCTDATFGNQCYPSSVYSCVLGDDNKYHLCPKGTSSCGSACYLASQYNCASGWLIRK